MTADASLATHPSVGRWDLELDAPGLGIGSLQTEILPDGTAQVLGDAPLSGVWQHTDDDSISLVLVAPDGGVRGNAASPASITASASVVDDGAGIVGA